MLEDMLKACVLDLKGSLEEHLPLVEFTYNNSYQASIQMVPYEALYGRPCRSPVCWTEVAERSTTGPELISDTSVKVEFILKSLLIAQSRQKSNAEVIKFGKWGKLSRRYIGPFEVLERLGIVAYRLALPPSLSSVHDVFHVSILRNYTLDPTHVVD